MPVLGRGYKKTAKAELERSIRKIEEEMKKAKTKDAAWAQTSAMQAAAANIQFAEQIRLITAEEANDYKDRIRKTADELQRERTYDAGQKPTGYDGRNNETDNDRGMTAAEWRREVDRQREQEQRGQKEQTHRSAPAKDVEEQERTK